VIRQEILFKSSEARAQSEMRLVLKYSKVKQQRFF
jgi:hypothetical protein